MLPVIAGDLLAETLSRVLVPDPRGVVKLGWVAAAAFESHERTRFVPTGAVRRMLATTGVLVRDDLVYGVALNSDFARGAASLSADEVRAYIAQRRAWNNR
ncbi:hypothetical protein [Streptomyces sp. NPDC002758]